MEHTEPTQNRTRESGQGLVEYALILVLVAVVMIVVLMMISPNLQCAYANVVAVLQKTAPAIANCP